MSLPFDCQKLRYFVPLSEISGDNFNELVNNINIETLTAGKNLFTLGDEDNFTYYLLSGEIDLIDSEENKVTLTSKSRQCRFPIEHNKPRQKTAKCITNIHYFRINNDLLDVLLTWDQNKNYIVNEIGDNNTADTDDNDWMTQLLQLELFHKIPPANIQAMFQRIESVPVKKDEVILKQGDTGDYYYIIKTGSCRVIQNDDVTGNKELEIAVLEAGKGFGEDALVSNVPRNATIIMNTDGMLMRLSKDDFIELLKEPILKSVNYSAAKEMVKEGAVLLDVRLLSEHQNKKIAGSINIPLFLLRLNANKLSHNNKYIVYCDTGSRSASATYILNEHGYDAYMLEGGLNECSNVSEESAA
ncbi:MAG: cyclic nucleotide-binding domain-containing protein [Gammaproteobacteria bacterium]|nr:cyclic nucleotide-binding domain-containing protein [Gammaproteobacteria bacterium]